MSQYSSQKPFNATTAAPAIPHFQQETPDLDQLKRQQVTQFQASNFNAEPITPTGSALDFMQFQVDAEREPTVVENAYAETSYMQPDLFLSVNPQDYAFDANEADKWLYIMGGDSGISNCINELLTGGRY